MLLSVWCGQIQKQKQILTLKSVQLSVTYSSLSLFRKRGFGRFENYSFEAVGALKTISRGELRIKLCRSN